MPYKACLLVKTPHVFYVLFVRYLLISHPVVQVTCFFFQSQFLGCLLLVLVVSICCKNNISAYSRCLYCIGITLHECFEARRRLRTKREGRLSVRGRGRWASSRSNRDNACQGVIVSPTGICLSAVVLVAPRAFAT